MGERDFPVRSRRRTTRVDSLVRLHLAASPTGAASSPAVVAIPSAMNLRALCLNRGCFKEGHLIPRHGNLHLEEYLQISCFLHLCFLASMVDAS
jgi:hypothetical protein